MRLGRKLGGDEIMDEIEILYRLLMSCARHPLTPKIVEMIEEIRRREGFFSRKQVREYLCEKYGFDPAYLDVLSLYKLLKKELEQDLS